MLAASTRSFSPPMTSVAEASAALPRPKWAYECMFRLSMLPIIPVLCPISIDMQTPSKAEMPRANTETAPSEDHAGQGAGASL
eukprot:1736422-Pleurochrysis_carterae.AAC.1